MKEINSLKIYRFDRLASTQSFCVERRTLGEDMLVVARSQSGGRGTKGRTFESVEGGLYCSLLLHDTGKAKEAFLCVARAAVAVCKTLEEFGVSPVIKWPNDVLCGGKKICGILIENVFSGGRIASTVWGIGLNVNNALSKEISQIATTMSLLTGKLFNLQMVEEALMKYFFAPFSYEEYLSRLGYIGKEVQLVSGDERLTATLTGVTPQGELLAAVDGQERRFAYGEVSITKESLL